MPVCPSLLILHTQMLQPAQHRASNSCLPHPSPSQTPSAATAAPCENIGKHCATHNALALAPRDAQRALRRASALLAALRRPSKTVIVNSRCVTCPFRLFTLADHAHRIAAVLAARRHHVLAAQTLRALDSLICAVNVSISSSLPPSLWCLYLRCHCSSEIRAVFALRRRRGSGGAFHFGT